MKTEVNIERTDIPKDIIENKKVINSITEIKNINSSGIPKDFLELDEISINQLLNFCMDNNEVCKWNGEKTHGNIFNSYLMSGVYPDEVLENVYEIEEREIELKRKNGDVYDVIYKTFYKIKDQKFHKRLKLEAISNWNYNKLNTLVSTMISNNMGNLTMEEYVIMLVQNGLQNSPDEKTRLNYIKIASKITGLDQYNEEKSVDIFSKGGKQQAQNVAENTNDSTLKIVLDDED